MNVHLYYLPYSFVQRLQAELRKTMDIV